MAKCEHFKPIKSKHKINCFNCHHWKGHCTDKAKSTEEYQDNEVFRTFDLMMRQNKGVKLDGD